MIYIAFLRGINVGGKNTVAMKLLKEVFEKSGMKSVSTYINTGNVIFQNDNLGKDDIEEALEKAIAVTFGFSIKIFLKTKHELQAIVEKLPISWENDTEMKCDVMFLWKDVDKKDVLEQLVIKPEIDDVKYVAGAILWHVDRKNMTRSGMMKLIGTNLYKQMTIRNCNTTRKLFALTKDI